MPTSKVEASMNIVPLSALFTPFPAREEPVVLCQTKPIVCPNCKWVANSFCQFDNTSFRWDCVNCGTKTPLHNQLREYITKGYTLPESLNRNSIIEYKLGPVASNGWVFLVDLCVSEAELQVVKEALARAVAELENTHVGVVAFGKHVSVYDLHSAFLCEVVVSGAAEYSPERLKEVLGLKTAEPDSVVPTRFMQHISSSRERLQRVIARLRPDSFATPKDNRKLRAAGQALGCAAALLEAFGSGGSRVVMALGGPCTTGPGKVIDQPFAQHFRSHEDLEKNSDLIGTFKRAEKYYDGLAERLAKIGSTVSVFAFSLDQFGAAEMRPLIEKTGGLIIHQEEFTNEVFAKSFERFMNYHKQPTAPLNANLNVRCSKELFLSGALGPLKLTAKSKNFPSDTDLAIGESGGEDYFIGSPLSSSTLCFFFAHRNPDIKAKSQKCYFQFYITYVNGESERILRVATFMREFVADHKAVVAGFDQEAAMAVISRLTATKSETLDSSDLVMWLNSVLVKLVRRFSTFEKGKPDSFRNAPELALIPQFMYYFRRSNFVQKFGSSVDEFALLRMSINRELVSNMLVMIQPTLVAYELNKEEATPVFCDIESLKPDIVILVDTYFYVLVWRGKQIHSWVQNEYHKLPEYENLKILLEQPEQDAKIILDDRLPVPKFIVCHQGSPNERLLKSKLTPANNPKSAMLGQQDENYITEDTSLATFMDYLIKLVIK